MALGITVILPQIAIEFRVVCPQSASKTTTLLEGALQPAFLLPPAVHSLQCSKQ